MKDKRFKLNHGLILETFEKEKSTSKTAELLNIKRTSVQFVLKKYNKQLSVVNAHRKHSCDETYFNNINTEEKAYWLGFLYADGCIADTQKNSSKKLQVDLAIKDIDHLIKLKKSLCSTHPVSKHRTNVGHDYVKFKVTSNDLCNALILQGCTPRKSLTLTFPKLTKSLTPHFIRGYFDGDGSVFVSKEKHWRSSVVSDVIHYRFIGTKAFLESVQDSIELGGNLQQVKQNKTYELAYKRNKKVECFYKYLYNNATIFMERKKIIFENHINKMKVQRLQ